MKLSHINVFAPKTAKKPSHKTDRTSSSLQLSVAAVFL